jgi:hypothetical protein
MLDFFRSDTRFPHTQYINAQYHASTRNGNFISTLDKKYPLNFCVFGLVTSCLQPNTLISLFCHLSSCSASSDGEAARWFSKDDGPDRGIGLEQPDPELEEYESEYGDDDLGESGKECLCRPKMR